MRFRHRGLVGFVLASLVTVGLSACVIGENEDPGCHSDAECGTGRFCRAGACFRIIGDRDAATNEDDAG